MYGVTSFRPGQLECLQAFSEGKDVWAQLPCGGGKTLVFIMSLLLHCTAEVGAIGILVQPLLSIRRGVVAKLENHGIEAITLDSSTSARVCNLLQSGRPTHPIVIVTSPEAITNNDAVLASLKQPAPPVGGQANWTTCTRMQRRAFPPAAVQLHSKPIVFGRVGVLNGHHGVYKMAPQKGLVAKDADFRFLLMSRPHRNTARMSSTHLVCLV